MIAVYILTGALCAACAIAGGFAGLWWGERNKGKVLERVYDHVRNRLPPTEESVPRSTALTAYPGR